MKVLYFMADWCAPCKRFLPMVEAVCHERGISLTKHDVGENPSIAQSHNVRSVPTTIICVGDDVRFHTSGVFHASSWKPHWMRLEVAYDYNSQIKPKQKHWQTWLEARHDCLPHNRGQF